MHRLAVSALLVAAALSAAACGGASASTTPTPSSSLLAAGGADGGGAGAGGDAGGGGAGGGGGTGGGAGSGAPTPPPSGGPNLGGPYVIDQAVTDGHATATVCSLTAPFGIQIASPKVTFTMLLTPAAADHGTLAYSYAFPSLGESHDATGSYTVGAPVHDGTRRLQVSVRDHVVFNGFDGTIPIPQTMTLKPAGASLCP